MNSNKLMIHLAEQYEKKNTAYGNNAHKTFVRYGKATYSMRLSDKMQRLNELMNHPEIDNCNESINDTLGDAITYSIMYSADLYCKKNDITEMDDTSNVNRTREILNMMACCSEDEILDMAKAFIKFYDVDQDRLADIIYIMYLDEKTTSTDYVLLAAYLVNIFIEREREKKEINT